MGPLETAEMILAPVGGVLEEQSLPDGVRETIVKYARDQFVDADSLVRRHRNTRSDYPVSHFFLVDGLDLNAYAAEAPPIALVGMKFATLVLLDDYFRR